MKWDEFKQQAGTVIIDGQILTDIECPKCGRRIIWDSRVELTSFPPKYYYWCECGWSGASFVKWKK